MHLHISGDTIIESVYMYMQVEMIQIFLKCKYCGYGEAVRKIVLLHYLESVETGLL